MKGYLDPSVIVGLLLTEPGWETLAETAQRFDRLCASDFGLGEVVAALASRSRAISAARSDLADQVEQARAFFGSLEAADCGRGDIARATAMIASAEAIVKLPDAIHIAIAERIGATVITSDRQQHRAAQHLGLPVVMVSAKQEPS